MTTAAETPRGQGANMATISAWTQHSHATEGLATFSPP